MNKVTRNQEPPLLQKHSVSGIPFRSLLHEIGFKEIPHFTVGNSLIYDLGRNQNLTISCLQTPNEMIFIGQIDDEDDKKITDLITLRNYDYDGYTSFETIKTIISSLTGRQF